MFKFIKKNYWLFVFGIILFHLLLLLKLKFTAWPEMLLWPYLMINNLMPYKDMAIAHTPHLLIDLVIFYKVFGIGIMQLKLFTWVLIVITDILFFWVTKNIWNKKISLIATLAYVLWQPFFDGNGLWFDLLLVPLSLFTFFLLQKRKYFWVGIVWTIMFLTKQTSVWFLLPIVLSITNKKDYKVFFKNFSIAVISTFILFLFSLWLFGILPSFLNWSVKFGIFILPRATGQIQLPDAKSLIVSLFPFLIFVPLFIKDKKSFLILISWALAGCLGAYPRFEYFHFQPSLPFLAIASGIVFSGLNNKNYLIKIFIPIYFIGSFYLFINYFLRNYNEGVRFLETNVSDVVSYVKANTQKGDIIFIMNWWDNIYPLTGTLPATDPWVPQLSWYQELPGVQDKEISDLKNSKPKIILLQNYSDSGLASYMPIKVYEYIITNYKLKEKVDGIEILIPK